MITPEQSRAARGLLDLRLDDLAARTGICAATIRTFESGTRSTLQANKRVMRMTLEAAGAVFIDGDDDAGPGVRLGHRPTTTA